MRVRAVNIVTLVIMMFLLACTAAKQVDEAERDLRLIREHWGAAAEPWIEYLEAGFVAYENRDSDTAARMLSLARDAGCDDPLVLYRLAMLFLNQGIVVTGSEILHTISQRLSDMYPRHVYTARLWLNLGNAEYRSRNFEAAHELYTKALLAMQNIEKRSIGAEDLQSDIYYSIAMSLRRMDRYAEAAAWMERADKKDYTVNFQLGAIYYDMKRYDHAMQRMRRAVQLNPASSRALGTLGNFYYARSEREEAAGQFDAAFRSIEQAVSLYRRAVAAGGEVYREYLHAAEMRIGDLNRLRIAAKKYGIQRLDGDDAEDVLFDPNAAPEEDAVPPWERSGTDAPNFDWLQ